nr:protein SHORT-ROOT [Ipomoea batatas]
MLHAARAVADKNTPRVRQLIWVLNEISSPYGDTDQKLAYYFLQALFSRVTDSGERNCRKSASASERNCSFESTRKTALKFQEISTFRRLQPRVLTVVEEEANLDVGVDGSDFITGFQECLRWFRVYFECLEESFPKTSNERLMLERQAGRAIVDLVACPPSESVERRETAARWSHRLHAGGFSPASYGNEVCDDVRALLRRYREGWSMGQCSGESSAGIFLSWKNQPVVWASVWKPALSDGDGR